MFEEAERIPVTVRRLVGSALDRADTEFIFVDDGSGDSTAEVTEKLLADTALNARVLRLPRNLGKGGAVRAGVLDARGEYIAFVDADLSADVDEVDRCFRILDETGVAVVVGTRSHGHSVIAVPQPPLRQASGKVFNLIVRLLGLTSLSDTQCGLKGFRRDVARKLFATLSTTGFAFDVELLHLAGLHGFDVIEMPVVWKHVEASRVRPFRDSVVMLSESLRIRVRLGRAPRRDAGEMPDDAFDAMARLEADHWWFRAKRELALQELALRPLVAGTAIDVGCGTGEMALALRGLGEDLVIGFDVSEYALRYAKARLADAHAGSVEFVRAGAETLPLPTSSVATLVSMDVVEHLDDDLVGLREYSRVLQPGGLAIVAVPAYQWAWSDHDERLGHRRRYTAALLEQRMRAAGFDVLRSTYYHSWLVPVAFLLRKTPLRRLADAKGSNAEEASFVNATVNWMLTTLTRAERRLQRSRDVPFGLSVMVVACKPGAPGTTAEG